MYRRDPVYTTARAPHAFRWRAKLGRNMADLALTVLGTRREQAFPKLERPELERLCRFGERRSFRNGEYLVRKGEVPPGMAVILSGEVAITHRDELGREQ